MKQIKAILFNHLESNNIKRFFKKKLDRRFSFRLKNVRGVSRYGNLKENSILCDFLFKTYFSRSTPPGSTEIVQ